MGPFSVQQLVGIAVAVVASLALHAIIAATTKRWQWTASLSGAATLLACALGLIVMAPPGAFPPKNVVEWPLWAALAGALMLAFAPTRRFRRAFVAALLAALLAAASSLLILHPLADFSAHALPYAIGIGVTAGAATLMWEAALAERGAVATRIALSVIATAGFATLMLAGSFSIASRAAVIPAAVAAPLALAWWRAPVTGLPAALAIALAGVATLGYALTDWTTPPRSLALAPAFALLALAPAGAWLAHIPAIRARPRLAATIAVAAVAVIAAAGVAWLALHQPVKSAGDDYGY